MSASLFQQLPQNSRVLFIRLRNLGEAVLDTANLRALKRFRPDLEIATLVEAIYADLYAADPDIEAIPLLRDADDKRSTFTARLSVIKEIRNRLLEFAPFKQFITHNLEKFDLPTLAAAKMTFSPRPDRHFQYDGTSATDSHC
jgi:hypothetical protein